MAITVEEFRQLRNDEHSTDDAAYPPTAEYEITVDGVTFKGLTREQFQTVWLLATYAVGEAYKHIEWTHSLPR